MALGVRTYRGGDRVPGDMPLGARTHVRTCRGSDRVSGDTVLAVTSHGVGESVPGDTALGVRTHRVVVVSQRMWHWASGPTGMVTGSQGM